MLSNAAGSVTSSIALLTIWTPPVVTSQPQSQTNIAGSSATFSVLASGVPAPAYQWKFNGQDLAGATGTSLVITNLQSSNAGNYTAVITNAAGSVTSGVAVLTVWVAPSFTLQPQSTTNVAGTDATFTVAGTGNPLPSYQWYFNTGGISGANASSLVLSNVQPANAGSYSAVLSNAAGSVTSSIALLTIWTPPVVTSQPQSQTNLAGTTASLSVAATGNPSVAFQWRFNGQDLAGATGASFVITNLQPSNAGNYSVVLTNAAGSVTSAVAVLTVWVAPAFTLQPQSLTNIAGTVATFNAAGSGNPVPVLQWLFNGNPLVGGTSPALILSNVQPANAGSYSAILSNAAGSVTSSIATLTVLVQPAIVSQPQSATNVVGGTMMLSVGVTGTAPLSYQWQMNGTNLSGATSSTVLLANLQPSDTGLYQAIASNQAGSITSAVASVLLSPSFTLQPVGAVFLTRSNGACLTQSCYNTTLNAAAVGSLPLAYQWLRDGVPLVPDVRITGVTSDTLSVAGVQPADAGSYVLQVSNLAGTVGTVPATLVFKTPAIQDPNVEYEVASALSRSPEQLTCADLLSLTNLDIHDEHVVSLAGLECASNLQVLYAAGNYLSSLAPLHALTNLSTLFLQNNHDQLVDISPLLGCIRVLNISSLAGIQQ